MSHRLALYVLFLALGAMPIHANTASQTRGSSAEPRAVARTLIERGLDKYQFGDARGAIIDLNQAILLHPRDARAFLVRGNAFSELGDKVQALLDLNVAVRLNPKDALALFSRGNVRDDVGDQVGAITDYDQAILLRPNYAEAYYNRGLIKSQRGDRRGAIRDLTDAQRFFAQQRNSVGYRKAFDLRSQLGG